MAMRYETYSRTFGVKACQPGHSLALVALLIAPIFPYAGLPMSRAAADRSGRFESSRHLAGTAMRLNVSFLIVHAILLVVALVALAAILIRG